MVLLLCVEDEEDEDEEDGVVGAGGRNMKSTVFADTARRCVRAAAVAGCLSKEGIIGGRGCG